MNAIYTLPPAQGKRADPSVGEILAVLQRLRAAKPLPGKYHTADPVRCPKVRSAVYAHFTYSRPVCLVDTGKERNGFPGVEWDSDAFTPRWFNERFDEARSLQDEH